MNKITIIVFTSILILVVMSIYFVFNNLNNNNYFYDISSNYSNFIENILNNLSIKSYNVSSLRELSHSLWRKHIAIVMYKPIALTLTYHDGMFLSNYSYNVSKAFKEAYSIAGNVLGQGVVAKIGNKTQGVYNPHKPIAYAAYVNVSFKVPLRHSIVYRYKWRTGSHGAITMCLGSPILIIPVNVSWSFPKPPLDDNINIVIAVYNESGKLAYYDVLGIHIGTQSTSISIPFQLPRPDSCSESYVKKGSIYYGMRFMRDADGDGSISMTIKIYVLVQKLSFNNGELRVVIPDIILFAPLKPR